ncbi:MAG TPA: hypothetical protein VJB08_01105 [Candidatus Nanoarchaeia archaeon]|nr:hypothetical protein [Candidatus Nanoarchaeia archaeon]
MVDYNIIRYCRLCKKRMVLKKGEFAFYCADCKLRLDKQPRNPPSSVAK